MQQLLLQQRWPQQQNVILQQSNPMLNAQLNRNYQQLNQQQQQYQQQQQQYRLLRSQPDVRQELNQRLLARQQQPVPDLEALGFNPDSSIPDF